LVGGIDKPRLIGCMCPGVSPGDGRPPCGLGLLQGDEFVVVGRIGDVRHSGSSCGGSIDKRKMDGIQ